jgi:hypothetical protein
MIGKGNSESMLGESLRERVCFALDWLPKFRNEDIWWDRSKPPQSGSIAEKLAVLVFITLLITVGIPGL